MMVLTKSIQVFSFVIKRRIFLSLHYILVMMNLAKRTSFSFTEALKTKKFFLLFGAPGVGKGPFARLLQKDLKMFHLSPSTEIRSIIRGGNSGGIEIQLIEKLRKVVKSGGLITDDLMMELIKEKLNFPEAENGLLLDGYPKTEHQLNHFFQSFSISGALNIVLREDVLLQRIKSRRACVPCRKTFYLEQIKFEDYDLPALRPVVQGRCDYCGKHLSTKEDDNEKVFRARLKQYNTKLAPLLERLESMGLLTTFEPKKGLNSYQDLLKVFQGKVLPA